MEAERWKMEAKEKELRRRLRGLLIYVKLIGWKVFLSPVPFGHSSAQSTQRGFCFLLRLRRVEVGTIPYALRQEENRRFHCTREISGVVLFFVFAG
jgi:hypothetical protein